MSKFLKGLRFVFTVVGVIAELLPPIKSELDKRLDKIVEVNKQYQHPGDPAPPGKQANQSASSTLTDEEVLGLFDRYERGDLGRRP